ncbi:MAG: MBL fold metallo-hydrolase [Parcubacteria group bacterium]
MKITFHGGAGSVTGANYLLEHGDIKIIVDCGLIQGSRYAESLNYKPLKYDPKEVDFVLVTHSHIDHIGRIPMLYEQGFRGKIYATTATRDLMSVALPDNAGLMIDDARDEGREPLFQVNDVPATMKLVEGILYGETIKLADDIKFVFRDAGHILGSSIIELIWKESDGKEKKIVFSGDLGNPPTPLLRPTEFVGDADYVVTESTYGDRIHEPRQERQQRLINIITETVKNKGVLMIPSFAMERTQELLYEFNNICENGLCPRVPFFIDSPLAIKITDVYKQHSEYFNKKTNFQIKSGDDIFKFPELTLTRKTEQSKAINDVPAPKIIIAGSGMSQGGRIIHHEKRYLPDPNSTILFVGYQVNGSLGRRIQQGQKVVKIHGQSVQVRCHRETISSYSAHADQPALIKWVEATNSKGNLKRVFAVQGEENASKTLANLLHDRCGIEAVVPKTDEVVEL